MRVFYITIIIFIGSIAVSEEKDYIDWKKGIVITNSYASISISKGRPVDEESNQVISLNKARIHAYKLARENAIDKLVLNVKKMRVDSNNSMVKLLKANSEIQQRISEIIPGKIKFIEYPVDYYTSGCRAELRITDLYPAFTFIYPGDEFPTIKDNPISTEYTSLIVDTRGLGIEPMIFPSVLNENGLEIYARHFIDIKYASKYGMVSYVYSEEEAHKDNRAGDQPFFTIALKNLNECPVISNKDTKKILSSHKTVDELKKCKVIFIINK